jgi:hypothetical protein
MSFSLACRFANDTNRSPIIPNKTEKTTRLMLYFNNLNTMAVTIAPKYPSRVLFGDGPKLTF